MFLATGQPGWMRFGGSAAPLANDDPESEKLFLKNQADQIQRELDSINERLTEIDKQPAKE